MKLNLILLTCLIILSGLFSLTVFGQDLKATAFEIRGEGTEYYGGKLYVAINGKKRKIAEQAKGKNRMLAIAPRIFLEAVVKTAKQLPTAKKVEVCEVGGTFFAFDIKPQIPKCQR